MKTALFQKSGFTQHHLLLRKSNKHNGYIRSGAGFTLIEMILAIAILGTVSTVGYLGLVQFNKNKDLGLATADFVNTLNEAKTDTQTQVGASTCSGASPIQAFVGYQVAVDTSVSPNKYQLQLVCSSSTTTLREKILPSSVSLDLKKVYVNYNASDACNSTSLSPATKVLFNAPGGSLDSSYAANLNNTEGVGIDSNGVILQCDSNCNVSLPCPASPTPTSSP